MPPGAITIRYPTAAAPHTLQASAPAPALRPGGPHAPPSPLLRAAARLCPAGAGSVQTSVSGRAPALRAQLPYVRLRDVSRRTRPGTVLHFLRRVLALRAHAHLDARIFHIDVLEALRALGAHERTLHARWLLLCDARAAAVDVALALALRPRALLLDGRAHSPALEPRILALARARAVPLVWDGCAPETARRASAHAFPPLVLPAPVPAPAHTHPQDARLAKSSSRPAAGVMAYWARAMAMLMVSSIVLQVDAIAYGGTIRAAAASALGALSGGSGAINIPWWRISTLLLLLGAVAVVSVRLGLGIGMRLGVAATRCFVQLGCLGLVLVPIIAGNMPVVVLSYLAFMMVVASAEAAGRPPYVFKGLFLVCCSALTGSVVVIASFVFAVVLGTGLDAQYIIPILGMVMGNSLSGISVAVSSIVTSIAERKDGMEALLALGATRWEATQDVVKTSIVLGLTPILNMMSVTGLVSIPGMMTGQIIGGTSPGLAARYQLVIMYVIAGSACSSVVSSTLLTVKCLTDDEHRIRSERLSQRGDQATMFARSIKALRATVGRSSNGKSENENSVYQEQRDDIALIEPDSALAERNGGAGSSIANQGSKYGAIPK